MTPLHTAVCQSQPDIVRQLLKAGADVRCLDEENSTPLHEAATIGNTKIAKLIMESCEQDRAKEVLKVFFSKTIVVATFAIKPLFF